VTEESHIVRFFKVLVFCLAPSLAAAQPVQVLHEFAPSPAFPNGALTRLPDGTLCGGLSGGVYCLAPAGAVTVTPVPGSVLGALTRGSDGGLYGTTREGAIFRFDPVTHEVRTLHVLSGANEGRNPLGGLVEIGGLLYGVARDSTGGNPGLGTLFSVDRTTGELDVLYAFTDQPAPATWYPTGPLALGPDGRLYGVTAFSNPQQAGAIYRFDPASGAFAIVHHFATADGISAAGPLALDVDGMFYGGGQGGGGADNAGTIFRFDPATNAVSVLYVLNPANGTDGRQPGPVTIGPDGHLYGTTRYGPQIDALPTVFRLRRLPGPAYAYDTLAPVDAALPGDQGAAPLTAGADGRMYGYSTSGGPAGTGTIFRFDLPPAGPPPGPVPLTVLHDFRPTTVYGPSEPVKANDGFLYGTTVGGSTKRGAVYRLDPTTGAVTILGAMPGPFAGVQTVSNSPLVLGPDGLLYGTSSSFTTTVFENRIVRVDPAAGVATEAAASGGTLPPPPAPTAYVRYSALVRAGALLYGLRYEGTGTRVFRFDPQTNTVTDVASSSLTQVSGLLAAADGQLYVTTTRISGFMRFMPLYDADLQRVNLTTGAFESVAALARSDIAISVGTPVQGPPGAFYIGIVRSVDASVRQVQLPSGVQATICTVGQSNVGPDLAVAPDGAVFGAVSVLQPTALFRCDPQALAATIQPLPPSLGWVASPLAAIDGAIYGASGGGSMPGGAIFRVAGSSPLPALDSEGDGLPNTWETAHGLDPFDAAGDDGASGDPDHDGRTNAQEFADGTHPRGFFTRYFAEGATGPFFRTRFDLVNPHDTTIAIVRVRWLTDAGVTVRHDLLLAAGSRVSIDPATMPGLAHASFSTVVESDVALGADRLMQWGAGDYGSSLETSVPGPATTWHFAEGSTSGDFALFYLLQNPQTTPVSATVRYLLPFGLAPIEKTYVLPPLSRTTIVVDAEPALTSTDVSAVITATAPIVAERAMYFSRPGRPFLAGHSSAGATAPSLDWFFAEGSTGSFFDLFVLLSNPGATAANVDVEYLLQGGSSLTKSYVVPANSRVTIWVDDEQLPAGSGQRPLANVAVSMRVHVTNGMPIVAERTMWWPGPTVTSDFWYETHNSPGATATATRWAIGGGDVERAAGSDTYVLIANPTATPARVRVSIYRADLRGRAGRDYDLPPRSRTTVGIGDNFSLFPVEHVGVLVESLGVDPVPVVVERASYTSPGGVAWSAGGAALASPLP
jgi:uncharacterized repeat protein (TIGR03803 family)